MIYMNNAATSFPKAPGVVQCVSDALNQLPGASHRAVYRDEEPVRDCRRRIADLMGVAEENQIVYAMNSTMALNMAMLGFDWKAGDVVLTTEAEHNSVLRPLYQLQKQGKITFHIMPANHEGRITPETFQNALEQFRPRMAVLVHGSNVTGAINDIETLAPMAEQYGTVILLDASQTLGLVPVLPEKWGVGMVAFTGHKYMLGPLGTGGLYVNKQIALEPVLTGGTGIHSDEDEMPVEMPIRLEAGTQNEPSFAGLGAALAWQEEHPVELATVLTHIHRIEAVLEEYGYRFPKIIGARTPVLIFESPLYTPEDIGEILYDSYDIICRTGLHCAPKLIKSAGIGEKGSVRISLSRFTTKGEVDVLVRALREMVLDEG